MKPIEFKGHNTVFAKDQPEYQPLPAFASSEDTGEVITCWHMNFWERLRVLWTGNIWVSNMTFHKPLQPMQVTTRMEDVFVLSTCEHRTVVHKMGSTFCNECGVLMEYQD